MVALLVPVVAELTRNFVRSVYQVLSATECMVVSVTEAPEVGHAKLGHLNVIPMMWFDSVGCGVEWRGYDVGGAVQLDERLVFFGL